MYSMISDVFASIHIYLHVLCIGMYCLYWLVLLVLDQILLLVCIECMCLYLDLNVLICICIVCIGLYGMYLFVLHVLVHSVGIGMYCVYCCVLCVLVCIAGISTYCKYGFVFGFVCIDVYLHAFVCITT